MKKLTLVQYEAISELYQKKHHSRIALLYDPKIQQVDIDQDRSAFDISQSTAYLTLGDALLDALDEIGRLQSELTDKNNLIESREEW